MTGTEWPKPFVMAGEQRGWRHAVMSKRVYGAIRQYVESIMGEMNMRVRLSAVATACVPLALLAVTACGPEESGAQGDGTSSSSGSSQGSGDADAADGKGDDSSSDDSTGGSGSGGSSSGSGGSSSGSAGGSSGGTGGKAPRCGSDVAEVTGGVDGDGESVTLIIKNTGKSACSIPAFPVVEAAQQEEDGSLKSLNQGQDNVGSAQTVTLSPGDSAFGGVMYEGSKSCKESAWTINVATGSDRDSWDVKIPGGEGEFIVCGGPLSVLPWAKQAYK